MTTKEYWLDAENKANKEQERILSRRGIWLNAESKEWNRVIRRYELKYILLVMLGIVKYEKSGRKGVFADTETESVWFVRIYFGGMILMLLYGIYQFISK